MHSQNYSAGDSVLVIWSSSGISGSLQIRLDYTGSSRTIKSSTSNDGSEMSVIPSGYPSRCDWHFVVTDSDDDVWDASDDFCIN